jgi:hypothetical protein
MTNDPLGLTVERVVPADLLPLLEQRDGAAKLLKLLPTRYDYDAVAASTLRQGSDSPHHVWESCGFAYKSQKRLHEAIAIFEALYEHLQSYQVATDKRAHKGAPLIWLSDCHAELNHPSIARRYLMLTLCEDAILHKGQTTSLVDGGFYFRAVWQHGLPHKVLDRCVQDICGISENEQEHARFPEWVLQHLDQVWMTTYPAPQETAEYRISPKYVKRLHAGLGDGTGKAMELLGHYLVSSIPGCRAHMRHRTNSTDLDVTGAFEGPVQDFRSDIGRYFVCECKDWREPASVTAFAKFSRILDSTKCRFGILFSREGLSGTDESKNAKREQQKLFQDRGIVVVVVDDADLRRIIDGANFITMLRSKYERVRLDLRDERPRVLSGS